MIVCICKSVSDRDLAKVIADGAQTVADVTQCTRAGSGCGGCKQSIQQSLDMAHGRLAKPLIMLRTWAAISA
jgi:bacterioferritin-associated ferredoxin